MLWRNMAASFANLAALAIPGAPVLTGTFRGRPMGCRTEVWRLSEEVRAGTITNEEFTAREKSTVRSKGHCNTMGTASTTGSTPLAAC